jgi:hypothetical protein
MSRAMIDLAQSQPTRRNRQKLLAPAYDWFTEGFETADLKEAKGFGVDGSQSDRSAVFPAAPWAHQKSHVASLKVHVWQRHHSLVCEACAGIQDILDQSKDF